MTWNISTQVSIYLAPRSELIPLVAGYRTVPIEMGKNYLSETAGQKLMTINEFICDYILPHLEDNEIESASTHHDKRIKPNPTIELQESPPIAYLAQHCLFDHIPIFKEHYMIPDYCCLLSSEDEEEGEVTNDEVIVNGWFGPIGTISPLHHDPYHNILAQVCGTIILDSYCDSLVGYKYVRLYSPEESENLYPMCESSRMSNNSQVDLLNPDILHFPNVSKSSYSDIVLCPGDILFIPR